LLRAEGSHRFTGTSGENNGNPLIKKGALLKPITRPFSLMAVSFALALPMSFMTTPGFMSVPKASCIVSSAPVKIFSSLIPASYRSLTKTAGRCKF
jgi:hypothetical protein